MLQDGGGITIDGLPWEHVLGPYGAVVLLLWYAWDLRKENKELRKSTEDMAKAALAALKKAGDE